MKKTPIAKRAPRARRKGKTDWGKVDALSDTQIAAAVKSDPDAELLTDEFWRHATLVDPRGKVAVSLRVDEDVLNAFREDGPGYQTRMNAVLRSYIAHRPKRKRSS